jgi:endonuclease YncB( thermonuclease family)
MQITLKNYKKLLTKIQQTIAKTKKNIVQSVDYQKVLMSWQIGKEIELHLKGQDKAGYGEQLFLQLTQDTEIEKSTLYKMHAFHKAYPKVPTENKRLSWSHYRSLIAVKDQETRQQLENLVVTKSLGSNRLQKEVAATKKTKKKKPTPDSAKIAKLKVTRGEIFNYQIKSENEIDLGFNIFFRRKHAFKIGEIVAVKKSGEKYLLKKSELKSTQIHTYQGAVARVVDGDTLHIKLDLGFNIFHHEILRLAKINAAEMATDEGKKSAAELKNILQDLPFVVVKTNKTDIYGRYIADVFLPKNKGEKDLKKIAAEGVYLSQMLLDLGLVQVF